MAMIETVDACEASRRCQGLPPEQRLLILADTTAPLAPHTTFLASQDGIAARFDGFNVPVIVAAGREPEPLGQLIDRLRSQDEECTVCLHETVPVPAWLEAGFVSRDTWMVRPTLGVQRRGKAVPLTDPAQLLELYRQAGTGFWTPRMLKFGHYWGILGSGGALLAAAGVHFILPDRSYAQLGGVATLPSERGRGYASTCITNVLAGLAETNIPICGLFADRSAELLLGFYRHLAFAVQGHYRFFMLKP